MNDDFADKTLRLAIGLLKVGLSISIIGGLPFLFARFAGHSWQTFEHVALGVTLFGLCVCAIGIVFAIWTMDES